MEVLLVSSRALCYFSAGFFADRIEEALELLGVIVHRIDIDEEAPDFDALECIPSQSLSAVIDINSKLPYLTDDNGDFWLDSLDVPFFNYILDHPLYHHPGLQFQLKNYHAIGIDRYHCAFMEKHYPHLKSITILPIAGTEAVNRIPFKERTTECLFGGTYIPGKVLDSEIKLLRARFGEEYYKDLNNLLDAWDPATGTLEECMEEYFKDKKTETAFPELINRFYPVDRIKRNTIREEILLALSEEIPVTVMGEGWEASRISGKKSVNLLPSRFYSGSIEAIASSKIVLDITPAFKCGIHDRASNAFANGSILLSNMSKEYDRDLADKKDMFYYTKDDIGRVVSEIRNMSVKEQESVACSGKDYYRRCLSWESHGKRLMDLIK